MHAKSSAATLTQTLPDASISGDDGDRTRDLVVANHALSQLSYIPVEWAYLELNQGPQLYQSCALAN